MDVIYATLIVRGYKTYAEVPSLIQPQVAEVLTELGQEELITEQAPQ
ncbi:CD1375 family protein [Gracilibacillus oryzae]|nr:CD1375 family protein [Gracilibacillus oryzae]